VRQIVFSIAALVAAASSPAAPLAWSDACYVRTEVFSATPSASAASAAAQSFVGVRRRSSQLVELDISVSGPNGATCSVAGIAKMRDERAAQTLVMPVRSDASRKSASSSPCQVLVQPTEATLELRTTPSCQEQALC
jgi:hypothetical protein